MKKGKGVNRGAAPHEFPTVDSQVFFKAKMVFSRPSGKFFPKMRRSQVFVKARMFLPGGWSEDIKGNSIPDSPRGQKNFQQLHGRMASFFLLPKAFARHNDVRQPNT